MSSSRCPHCHGVVSILRRSRKTLDEVLAVHAVTCPGVLRVSRT